MYNTEISNERREELEQLRCLHSIEPFGNLPLKDSPDSEDVCILGVPFDTTTTGRPGTRFGPRAIRRTMKNSFDFYSEDNKWKIDNLSGIDMGDSLVSLGYTEESLQLIYEATKKILDANAIPVIIGGEHLITYPELRAYYEKYGPVAIIHFDSHEDTWNYEGVIEIEYNHGTPFRNAIEDGFMDASHSIQLGIRGNGESYRLDYANDHGMKVITARELHDMGIDECAKQIREQVGDSKCIITFDIDFLDPSFAPGTGTPVPGGFSTYEALEIIQKGITGLNVVGCDLVEVAENFDQGELTALAGAHLIQQFLVLLSKNKAMKE